MTKSQRKSRNSESQDVKKAPGQGDVDHTEWAVLSNLRHELGTLLNAIIGYSEMLLEDAEDFGKKIYISELAENSRGGQTDS